MTAEEAIAAFAYGAPGIEVGYSIDQDGVLTIDNWKGPLPPPTIQQVEQWAVEALTIANTQELNETTIRDQMMSGMDILDTHLAVLAGAPTAAQQKQALIFALKAIKQLARLRLKKLDAID